MPKPLSREERKILERAAKESGARISVIPDVEKFLKERRERKK